VKATIGALLVFVAVALSGGWLSGIAHDEGVTLDISVGGVPAELVDSFRPVPIDALYAGVDGRAGHPVSRVISEAALWDNPHPPAYYLVMHAWTSVAGVGRLALRLPSMVFALCVLLGLARLARRVAPFPGVGPWVVLLAGLSPWFVAIATFARPYAMTMAVGVWATIAAMDIAADEPRTRGRARAVFAALSLLGLYTLYHYVFVVAWQGLFLALVALRAPRERRSPQFGALALLAVIVSLGFVPWLPNLVKHLDLTGSVPSYYLGSVGPSAMDAAARLLATFFIGDALVGPPRWTLLWGLAALGALAAVLVLRSLWRRREGDDANRVVRTFLLATPLYPALIVAADALHGTRTAVITKTSLLLYPLLLLLVMRGWSVLAGSWARIALLGLCVLTLGTAAGLTIYKQHTLFEDHHRAVARTLAAHDEPEHLVVVNSLIRGHGIPLLLTLQERGVQNLRVVFAPPPQLEDVVARACADASVDRITLLNLHAVYAHDDSQVWTPELLGSVSRTARRAGWNVVRSAPVHLAQRDEPVPSERRFEVVAPVW
jgi:hypothetical protein